MLRQAAVPTHIRCATHEARPDVGAQTELPRNGRHRDELVVGLSPLAVVHGSDRQSGGDAVAKQLRKGVANLESFFLGGVRLSWAALQVVLRPQTSHLALITVFKGQHARVQIAQRVQIDQPRANQGQAVIHGPVHVTLKRGAHVLDRAARKDELGISPQFMAGAVKAHHIGRFESCSHLV